MSEKVLSVAASNEYHLDRLTRRKSILHLFCTSLKTRYIFLLYINISAISRNTVFLAANYLGCDASVFYLIGTSLQSIESQTLFLAVQLEGIHHSFSIVFIKFPFSYFFIIKYSVSFHEYIFYNLKKRKKKQTPKQLL